VIGWLKVFLDWWKGGAVSKKYRGLRKRKGGFHFLTALDTRPRKAGEAVKYQTTVLFPTDHDNDADHSEFKYSVDGGEEQGPFPVDKGAGQYGPIHGLDLGASLAVTIIDYDAANNGTPTTGTVMVTDTEGPSPREGVFGAETKEDPDTP
jgi:hypothetical protein